MPEFRHLHCHTRHSRLDGYGTEEQWVARALELGHDSLAVTDHGNLCALPGLAKAAQGKLKVIYGCEFYLSASVEDKAAEQKALGTTAYPHVTVLAATQVGYGNLVRLSTFSNERGYSRYPRIDFEALARHQEGLVVLSGCPGGWPTRLLRSKGEEECAAWLQWFAERVERFYIELDPAPRFEEARPAFRQLLSLARELALPTVMTADAHFPRPTDWPAQDALCAVGLGKGRDDPSRAVKMPPDQFACAAVDLFARARAMFDQPPPKGSPIDDELRTALWRSGEIAASCEPVELPKAKPVTYAGLKPKEKASEVLWEWLLRGIDERQKQGLLPARGYSRQDYLERATYEWGVLTDKGFADYLLIVIDLVRHIKGGGGVVLTRGSAGGCLLLWLCGASVTDSLKHELSFERFFDASRSDPPDVDLDFEEQDRSNALDYLRVQYGQDRVAQLAAYGELHCKAAIKDSAMALGISSQAAQAVSNALRGDKDDLLEQLAEVQDPYVQKLLQVRPDWGPLAATLIGQIRNSSIHAAGVVVGSESFDGRLPLMRGKGEQVVAAVDKKGAKQLGYLKIDTLVVDSLDIVGRCLQFLGREPAWLEQLPLDDPGVYQLAADRLADIFQLDGTAARYAVRQIGLREFADLAVCGSICRPGAVTHVEHFARCRRDPAYLEQQLAQLHPGLDKIVQETCGVLLYQEQVMRLANELAGLPMTEVQLLRRGISDKLGTQHDLAKAAAWRNEWGAKVVEGLQRVSGFTEEAAIRLWEVIEAHGGYSFNRCISGDTIVYWGGAGRSGGNEISVADLYAAQESRTSGTRRWTPVAKKIRAGRLTILQMGADGRVRPGRLKQVIKTGEQATYEVRTVGGRAIRATANHRLLTTGGYLMVSQLTTEHSLVVQGPKESKPRQAKQTERAIGRHYAGKGVPSGSANPSWIDGRTTAFAAAKSEIRKRADGHCEHCGCPEQGRFEAAHLLSLEQCSGNYSAYHRAENLKWLCNSCHKRLDYEKGERPGRFARGYPTEADRVVSIEFVGVEPTYDIEMATEEHNFIANGIVSHNSHCYTYAMLSYWMLYLKVHHAREFYRAALEQEERPLRRKELIREFRKFGAGEVRVFDPQVVTVKGGYHWSGMLVGGLADLTFCGEKSANKIVATIAGGVASWEELLSLLPGRTRKLVQRSGLAEGRVKDQAALLVLAPWFPVQQLPEGARNCRAQRRLPTSVELENQRRGAEVCQVSLLGYVAHRDMSPKHAGFTLEDEFGTVDVRVGKKKLAGLGAEVRRLQVGDLVGVVGWWNGDCLYLQSYHALERFDPKGGFDGKNGGASEH